MNLKKFVESLTSSEKRELFDILSEKPKSRLRVKEWVLRTNELSARAKTALTYSDLADMHMDEITDIDLIKVRNLGKVTLKEILELYPFIRK